MKKKLIPIRQPKLYDIFETFLSCLLAWADWRFSRLADWKQVVLVLFFIFNVIMTAVVGIDHLTLDKGEYPNRWPWQVYGSWAGSAVGGTLRVAGKVACWPIKKVVECCVPGYQAPPDMTGVPTVFYLTADKCLNEQGVMHRWRGIVIGKTVDHPVYTVQPRILYSYESKCGNRWQFDGDDNTIGVRVLCSPKADVYLVQLQGAPHSQVYVLPETWEKVKTGDILEGCNAYQDGVDINGHHEATIVHEANFELPYEIANGGVGGVNGAHLERMFPAMMEAMRKKLLAGDAAECAKEAADAKKLEREKKEHPDRFNDYGDRMTD